MRVQKNKPKEIKSTFNKMSDISKDKILKADYPPKKCICGNDIFATFTPPVYVEFLKRNMKGTNEYIYNTVCDKCLADIETKKQKENTEKSLIQEREQKENKRIERLNYAGFFPKHKEIIKQKITFNESLNNLALYDNLFLFGSTGSGKTCFAVKRLYDQINSGKSGKIRIFPEMLLELRRAVKDNTDGDLLDSLTNLDCLAIDDFGVGRFTVYVLELVYMILERWYSNMKTGLTITCNKPLKEIAKIDDRFSSRIAGMCKIIKLDGQDFRLNKNREE